MPTKPRHLTNEQTKTVFSPFSSLVHWPTFFATINFSARVQLPNQVPPRAPPPPSLIRSAVPFFSPSLYPTQAWFPPRHLTPPTIIFLCCHSQPHLLAFTLLLFANVPGDGEEGEANKETICPPPPFLYISPIPFSCHFFHFIPHK